jgi:elongation factor Tu
MIKFIFLFFFVVVLYLCYHVFLRKRGKYTHREVYHNVISRVKTHHENFKASKHESNESYFEYIGAEALQDVISALKSDFGLDYKLQESHEPQQEHETKAKDKKHKIRDNANRVFVNKLRVVSSNGAVFNNLKSLINDAKERVRNHEITEEYDEKFDRRGESSKLEHFFCPHLSVAVFGSHNSGKTMLVSALTHHTPDDVDIPAMTCDMIDGTDNEQKLGRTIHVCTCEMVACSGDGTRFHYSLMDLPGHEEHSDGTLRGLSAADVALLVISMRNNDQKNDAEAMRDIFQHALAAKQMGVKRLVVYINVFDESLIDQGDVDQYVNKLTKYLKHPMLDFQHHDTPVIVGSAKKALDAPQHELGSSKINKLISEMNRHYQPVVNDLLNNARKKPDCAQVLKVLKSDKPDHYEILARIRQGEVNNGEKFHLYFSDGSIREAKVVHQRLLGSGIKCSYPGDNVKMTLYSKQPLRITQGQILVEDMKHFRHTRKIKAEIYPRRGVKIRKHAKAQFQVGSQMVDGDLKLNSDFKTSKPNTAYINFYQPVILLENDRFVVKYDGQVVAAGKIIDISH